MSGKCCSCRDRDEAVLEPPARPACLAGVGVCCAQVSTNPTRSCVLQQPGARRSAHALQSGTSSVAAHCLLQMDGTAALTQQGHSCLWEAAQSSFLPAWSCGLTSPRSLTCSPCGVLCHMIPAQHIPAAKQELGTTQMPCIWGGFYRAYLANKHLGLLRAGGAYLHILPCPICIPIPHLQASLSTQISYGSVAKW